MRASSEALSIDSAVAARTAGRDWLSLALIDARNGTLAWLARFEQAGKLTGDAQQAPSPLLMAGRAGWLQEWWIARNVRRLAGPMASEGGLRLPGLDRRADEWFRHTDCTPGHVGIQLPDAASVRSYLEATLEQTLELLAGSQEDDDALWVYRRALRDEDHLGEVFAEVAHEQGVEPAQAARRAGPPPARAAREALWLPAQRFMLGSVPGGLVPDNEQWAHEEAVPEFEIDAQAVSWARYVEFAEDGGYDRDELWSPEGWQWLQGEARRSPRGAEQLRGGALVQRFGRLQRAPAAQAVCHVSWFEAEAWCRWAQRRLPTEIEWELAASVARSRGFVWGDVWEWAAGTARHWPAGPAVPPTPVPRRVLRGASSWTVPRARHVKRRRFMAAERDEVFCGFRSCAL
jgi:formylglycine-generating enzyme required for sulfatase activity